MSTASKVGEKPVVISALADGESLVYNAGADQWENGAASGGVNGAPQFVGNLRRQEIDDLLLGVPVKLGGFTLDPGIFTGATFAFSMTAILTDGGGVAPTFTLELYDMGAPGVPAAGVLRSQAVLSTTGAAVRTEVPLTLSGAPGVDADEIFNTERIYEVRGTLTGDIGDLVEIDWAGILGT